MKYYKTLKTIVMEIGCSKISKIWIFETFPILWVFWYILEKKTIKIVNGHRSQSTYILQGKFQEIQRKISKISILKFKPSNPFEYHLKALVCIPEVLRHLLTPILPYLYMTCVGWHMCQIWSFWHFWHKWRIWHPTFVIYRYGNMGV